MPSNSPTPPPAAQTNSSSPSASAEVHVPPTFVVPPDTTDATVQTPNASSSKPSVRRQSERTPSLPVLSNATPLEAAPTALRLTRTHSRKELYDADTASVDGECGAYGHAPASLDSVSPSEPIQRPPAALRASTAPTQGGKYAARSKSYRRQESDGGLEKIHDAEHEDLEKGQQVDGVRADDGIDAELPRRSIEMVTDLEKQVGAAAIRDGDVDGGAAIPYPPTSRTDTDTSHSHGRSLSLSRSASDGGDGNGDGEKAKPDDDPDLVTWSSPDSQENPRNWSKRRRWAVVLIVSSYAFLSPLASSMIAPALPLLSAEFNVTSSVIQDLMLSSFVLAYAVGPLVLAPLSEMYGRRVVLQTSNVLFLAFNLACGGAQSSVQMSVFRFFAGLGGSAPLSAGGGTVADLFDAAERGSAMALYVLAPLLGPAIGPVVGGWIVQKTGHWRWIFWSSSIYSGLTAAVGLWLLPETYAPRILQLKADRLRKETGNEHLHTIFEAKNAGPWYLRLRHNLVRPFVLLTTQPIIQVLAVYVAILYGTMYILLTLFPRVFAETYNEKPGIASLNYLSLAIGFSVGGQVGGRLVDRIYCRLRDRNGGVGQPEFKLPLLMFSSFLLPVGLLIYGWSAEYAVFWIVPDIGAAIFSMGMMASFVVCQGFLVDVMPLYAASTLAAAVFLRSLAGFGFPLFAPVMYEKLGQGWGNSILALAAAVFGIPMPFVLWKYGPYLRSKSRYASKQRATLS